MDNIGKLEKTLKTEEEKRNKPENSVRFFFLFKIFSLVRLWFVSWLWEPIVYLST